MIIMRLLIKLLLQRYASLIINTRNIPATLHKCNLQDMICGELLACHDGCVSREYYRCMESLKQVVFLKPNAFGDISSLITSMN